MNWDSVKGNWNLVRGNPKLQWGKLTHDPLSMIAGKYGQLTGSIQKTSGDTKQLTQTQLDEFVGPHKNQGLFR